MSSSHDPEQVESPNQTSARDSNLPLTIGIMGGADAEIPPACLLKAEQLGEAVAVAACVVITGACPGLPLAAARGAKRRGGTVIGISPALSLDEVGRARYSGGPSGKKR